MLMPVPKVSNDWKSMFHLIFIFLKYKCNGGSDESLSVMLSFSWQLTSMQITSKLENVKSRRWVPNSRDGDCSGRTEYKVIYSFTP